MEKMEQLNQLAKEAISEEKGIILFNVGSYVGSYGNGEESDVAINIMHPLCEILKSVAEKNPEAAMRIVQFLTVQLAAALRPMYEHNERTEADYRKGVNEIKAMLDDNFQMTISTALAEDLLYGDD